MFPLESSDFRNYVVARGKFRRRDREAIRGMRIVDVTSPLHQQPDVGGAKRPLKTGNVKVINCWEQRQKFTAPT